MKKVLALTLAALAALALFAGCSKSKTDPGTIVVGASVTPHAEILEQVRELLKEKGFELEIVEFTDYVIPNTVRLYWAATAAYRRSPRTMTILSPTA